jgi:hypothetical protein
LPEEKCDDVQRDMPLPAALSANLAIAATASGYIA